MSLNQSRANRLNAKKSTGPRTIQGKRAVRRNAIKHALNVAVSHEADPLFWELCSELIQCGYEYEEAITCTNALLELRRVMSQYSAMYWAQEEYIKPNGITVEMLLNGEFSEDGLTNDQQEKRILGILTNRPSRSPREFARCMAVHPLRRYQRSAVSRLSRALRGAKIAKMTKQSHFRIGGNFR